jgi:hypothetical protein
MIAVLVMDLPSKFNTEATLIEMNKKYSFEEAVELLRSREQKIRVNGDGNSSSSSNNSVNSVQNGERDRKSTPCDVCGRFGHTSNRCYRRSRGRGAQRGGRRGRGRA